MSQSDVNAPDFIAWLLGVLRTAPTGGCQELLDPLWVERKIQLVAPNTPVSVDALDEILARLSVAAWAKRGPVLLTLPNDTGSSAALMLATLVLGYWWIARQNGTDVGHPLLYVGAAVGIRDDLGKVTVRGLGLRLSDTVQHTDLTRSGAAVRGKGRGDLASGLPKLLTAYAPADVASLVHKHSPPLIAADLGEHTEALWTRPLIDVACESRVPLVMWVRDPIAITESVRSATLVSLPGLERHEDGRFSFRSTSFRPLVMSGPSVGGVARAMAEASTALGEAARRAGLEQGSRSSVLVSDAIRVHRLRLRVLELMPCPVDLYDAGSSQYWGLTSTGDLQESCARFRSACGSSYADVTMALVAASAHLDEVEALLRQANPLWDLACALVIEAREEGLELLFGALARRKIFLDALLVAYGISEQDLSSIGVGVAAFSGLVPEDADFGLSSAPSRHVVIGTIGRADEKRLASVSRLDSVEIAVYPHQVRPLQARVTQWAQSRAFRPDQSLPYLGVTLTGAAPETPARVVLLDASGAEVREGQPKSVPPEIREWVDPDLEAELQRTYDLGHDLDEQEPASSTMAVEPASGTGEDASLICDKGLRVQFRQGWRATFALDQELMFVRRLGKTATTEVRPAHELQPGVEIVAIHGQRRQSLYDLLVNRLHTNPAVALHLALIRQWQRELASAYLSWSRDGRNLDVLVEALEAKGSSITSTLAVRFWLSGHTIAPQDPKDIARVAEILSMPFASEHHARIAAAASRLRGLHRGLSNRISRWLERQVAAGPQDDDHEPLDRELGVTFEDFASTLLYLTVESTEELEGPFLRASLGYFHLGADS